ncbi:MAG: hypothetical protein WC955_02110 [Elusimicrobiota bacterium]
MNHNKFENLGVQSKVANVYGYFVSPDGKTVYINFGQLDKHNMFLIGVSTDGVANKYTPPATDKDGKWQISRAYSWHPERKKWYFGTTGEAWILEFDPVVPEKGLIPLLRVDTTETYLNDMAVSPDGKVYVGTYPGCKVIEYNPYDNTAKNVCVVSDKNKYANSVAVSSSTGKIYAGAGIDVKEIVCCDPKTGETQSILPQEFKMPGHARVLKNVDGQIVAIVDNKTFLITEKNEFVEGKYNTERNPVYYPATLADGRKVVEASPIGFYILQDSVTGKRDRIKFEYEGDGIAIHAITLGPDNNIYGSTILPLSMFKYITAENVSEYLGVHLGAEVYCFTNYKNKMFEATYPLGRTFVSDVGEGIKYNPRRVTDSEDKMDLGGEFMRPLSMITVGDKIYIAGTPDYGSDNGGLAVIDAVTEKVIDKIVPVISNQSIKCITYEPVTKRIYGGTSVAIGHRKYLTKYAKMFVFNPETKKVEYETELSTGEKTAVGSVMMMATIAGGKVVGLMTEYSGKVTKMFVYDAVGKRFVMNDKVVPLKTGPKVTPFVDSDGKIYCASNRELFVIDPKSYELTVLAEFSDNNIASQGVVKYQDYLYFAVGACLYRYYDR